MRDLRRGIGLRRAAEASLVVQPSVLAKRLICPVSTTLRFQSVLQPPSGQAQPLGTRAWDRPCVPPPLLLELAVRFPQPSPPPVRADQLDVEPVDRVAIAALVRSVLTLGLGPLARQLALKPLAPASLGLKLRR